MRKKIRIITNSLRFQSFTFLKYVFFKHRRMNIKKEATKYFYNLPAVDFDLWANDINKDLYNEMKLFQKEFKKYEQNFNFTYLGGARGLNQFAALYFFTRLIQPKNILETGVANGYSSFSFLSALKKNDFGNLVSNDLPPLDIKKDNWKYIGQMVPENFKDIWILHLGSDKKNLKSICKATNFELVHFDSDKTTSGKMFCIDTVIKHNSTPPLILIDNCADDFFWKSLNIDKYKKIIFEQNGKRFGSLIFQDDTSKYRL